MQEQDSRICASPKCDKPLVRRGGEDTYHFNRRKTCDNVCFGEVTRAREAARWAHLPDMTKQCVVCGATMRRGSQGKDWLKKKTCSRACAMALAHGSPAQLRDASWLRVEYVEKCRSSIEIGAQLGVSSSAVTEAMRRLGVPVRTAGETQRLRWAVLKERRNLEQERKTLFPSAQCVFCGTADHLTLHHRDGDRSNNSKRNLVVVCGLHHRTLERIIWPLRTKLAQLERLSA